MPKFVFLPPQNQRNREWAERFAAALPEYVVAVPEDEQEAAQALTDTDAAFGWVPPELLPAARQLRWLQNPNVGPHVGYYYPALIEHPVVVCNPRGVFDDHIGQHIMMFVLALARGLPDYLAAQQNRQWNPDARTTPYVDLASSTALIAGVGGIGHEAARLCHAFGMRVIGVDPRWEHEAPYIEKHGPDALDELLPTPIL